ncbi:response regulator [Schlesneria sp. DSM 10557]|uniref:response regulator n=1 Tax=Schlesneria sp. DSM 10557 TaxID=3044399 RepID=UPI00359FC760
MLVLSRRPGQRVVFPGLGITIDVLRSAGSVVRLGIEAPNDVKVLREEVLDNSSDSASRSPAPTSKMTKEVRELSHAWRNKLNLGMLKLQLLQRKIEIGETVDLEANLSEVLREFSDLERATHDAVVEAKSTTPKVLIVEDQANERELLATCLRLGGFEVATAGNGREAFDYLHEHELPDIVLLDMRMPDVDGPTFLKSVRSDLRLHDLRVFAVSGSSRNEFDSEPLQLDGWISKPVRIDALIRAVSKDQSSKPSQV